jgi:type III restriction enzyme
VFTDGTAADSVEAEIRVGFGRGPAMVIVYAKFAQGARAAFIFRRLSKSISPDWAISFKKGTVKHIFFIAETKGTMDSLELRPIERAKISCAKKLFNEISTSGVKYHDVDSYQTLLEVMETL